MKYRGQEGFSLVELLVTIGIIAVVAAIAIPQLQSYATNSRLKSAARDVMGDIFLYKERAIAENRQYRITFNIGGNTYTIEQPPGTIIQTKTPTTFGNDIRISNVGTTETVYTFQTRGTVNAGTVVLINDRGSTATITTNITGRTSVQFNLQ
ncbi:MAG: prepilin-type N-terminal cleavage/methylation domain-containing protein [Thermodesulfovibrionales bacterium]|jgi:type IV fimbrial biogenesis protein FimT|nr:prepilin-type N-terminal cleavage/methylation domain-containing protein [Thermodesulfovibrionales bacterium]